MHVKIKATGEMVDVVKFCDVYVEEFYPNGVPNISYKEVELELPQSPVVTTPKQLLNPNLTELRNVCQSRIDEVLEGNGSDSDTPHYIYETAMTTIFGADIFKWLNKRQ